MLNRETKFPGKKYLCASCGLFQWSNEAHKTCPKCGEQFFYTDVQAVGTQRVFILRSLDKKLLETAKGQKIRAMQLRQYQETQNQIMEFLHKEHKGLTQEQVDEIKEEALA